MLITKKCILTHRLNTLDIPVTKKQYERFKNRYYTGEYIQDIFPDLTSSQREFLMTGIIDETWQKHMLPSDGKNYQ